MRNYFGNSHTGSVSSGLTYPRARFLLDGKQYRNWGEGGHSTVDQCHRPPGLRTYAPVTGDENYLMTGVIDIALYFEDAAKPADPPSATEIALYDRACGALISRLAGAIIPAKNSNWTFRGATETSWSDSTLYGTASTGRTTSTHGDVIDLDIDTPKGYLDVVFTMFDGSQSVFDILVDKVPVATVPIGPPRPMKVRTDIYPGENYAWGLATVTGLDPWQPHHVRFVFRKLALTAADRFSIEWLSAWPNSTTLTLLSNVTPNAPLVPSAPKIGAYNAELIRLKDQANARGLTNVSYRDITSGLNSSTDPIEGHILPDGGHPNAQAMLLMALALNSTPA